MTQDANEATRVMGAAGGPPVDRTMVAGAPMTAQGGAGGGATQMGSTVTCPVCRTNNSSLETFCGECGFLLSSAPGQVEEPPADAPIFELVENSTGRRFRLKEGVNIIGRENCDVLLMEGTVSRRHAQVTVENGLVILMDLGSSNGTQIDGTRIGPNQPMPLANNSTLRFGNATMTAVAPTGSAEATIMASAPAEPTVAVSTPPNAVDEQTLMAPAAPETPATQTPEPAPLDPALSTPIATPPPAAAAERIAIAQLRPAVEGTDAIYVGEGTITVGRRAGNDIVITGDPYISGRHCDITCDASGCYLTDVGSTNGTMVNGTRLEPHQKQLLLDGDSVTIGQTEYTFETLDVGGEEEPAGPLGDAEPAVHEPLAHEGHADGGAAE
jgi:pSer/pThr/pTyr-binding forkhead associated (FHA) protein